MGPSSCLWALLELVPHPGWEISIWNAKNWTSITPSLQSSRAIGSRNQFEICSSDGNCYQPHCRLSASSFWLACYYQLCFLSLVLVAAYLQGKHLSNRRSGSETDERNKAQNDGLTPPAELDTCRCIIRSWCGKPPLNYMSLCPNSLEDIHSFSSCWLNILEI